MLRTLKSFDIKGQTLLIRLDLNVPIHDEVIAQAPKAQAAEVAREIETVMSNDLDGVPLTAEAEVIGFRWGDKYAPKEVIHA